MDDDDDVPNCPPGDNGTAAIIPEGNSWACRAIVTGSAVAATIVDGVFASLYEEANDGGTEDEGNDDDDDVTWAEEEGGGATPTPPPHPRASSFRDDPDANEVAGSACKASAAATASPARSISPSTAIRAAIFIPRSGEKIDFNLGAE